MVTKEVTMKTQRAFRRAGMAHFASGLVLFGLAAVPSPVFGQTKNKHTTSKVYVADVRGNGLIDTGDRIQDLEKRSVYTAEGTVIETGAPVSADDANKIYSTMVYSNGTGAYFDADTRVEVKNFVQEPFTPDRSDIEAEPSISKTHAFVVKGTVGICASKLVAGSSMNYDTAFGSVNIRGRKVVIEAKKDVTRISMLEGESTVRAGVMDMGGHTLRAGEQATIRPGPAGQPNIIQIGKIPEGEKLLLDDKVAMACAAKKTVYFDVKEQKTSTQPGSGEAAGAGDGPTPSGPVTAFDDASSPTPLREIVPVQVVPIELPVKHTMTPARAVETTAPTGG